MAHVHGEAAVEVAKKGAHGMMEMMAKHPMPMAAMGGMAAGAAAGQGAKRGLLHSLAKHPLLVFGVGLAAGYMIHKYRREIIDSAVRVTEQGKDFVLQQRENLEDMLAESREQADQG